MSFSQALCYARFLHTHFFNVFSSSLAELTPRTETISCLAHWPARFSCPWGLDLTVEVLLESYFGIAVPSAGDRLSLGICMAVSLPFRLKCHLLRGALPDQLSKAASTLPVVSSSVNQ